MNLFADPVIAFKPAIAKKISSCYGECCTIYFQNDFDFKRTIFSKVMIFYTRIHPYICLMASVHESGTVSQYVTHQQFYNENSIKS